MKRILTAVFVLLPLFAQADERWRASRTSVIEDSVCIPELNGEGFLHVDEDVSGLIVSVVDHTGAESFLYDAGTEIEDVAVPGTGAYSAPSANNVRVSPDGHGGDCTEFQFADAVYATADWITFRVTDGQTTIMDFSRTVYLNTITSRDTGLMLLTDVDTATSQTELILSDGASNNDAYPVGSSVQIIGGTEECETYVTDYVGATTTVHIAACPALTVAAADIVRIRASASGAMAGVIESQTDDIGTGGAGLTEAGGTGDQFIDLPILNVDSGELLQNTTIATLSSQVSFTLTAGSADNNAYNGGLIVVVDQSTATQKAVGEIRDYVGSTKTVVLAYDPGIFTMAAGDTVYILARK